MHTSGARCVSAPSSAHPRPFRAGHARRPTVRRSSSGPAFAVQQESSISSGRLYVRPLEEGDMSAACVVLTRAFVGTPEQVTMPNAVKYTRELLDKAPDGVLLVARVRPNDPQELPPNQDTRLVGTLALALTAEARSCPEGLPPPDDAAYVSNVAVDTKYRRQGIARQMMLAAEGVARQAGVGQVALHVRVADPAAQELYTGLGYREVAREGSFMLQLKGQRPRILMLKQL